MAVAYHLGGNSMADAYWSDGAGFNNSAADPQLIVADHTGSITDGLSQGSATNPTDFLWFLRGAPLVVGTDGSALTYKPDATYTTDPNFIWQTTGGTISVAWVTNACTLAVIDGGGTVNLTSGTITTLVVHRGNVVIGASCVVTTLIVTGGTVTIASGTAVTTGYISGGRVDSDRRVVTGNLSGTGVYRDNNTSGSTMTTMNHNGGSYLPIAGGVATYNWNGGSIVLTSAERELTLGATAFVNRSGTRIPSDTTLVTFSNKTDYAVVVGGGIGQT